MATSAQLRKQILQGSWDAVLAALYGANPAVLQRQRGRYAAALEQFELYFGPGRQVQRIRCTFVEFAGHSMVYWVQNVTGRR